jgi:hypothetical protein
LAHENIVVRLDLLSEIEPSSIPDYDILATRFPFDTILTGLIRIHPDSGILYIDRVNIPRYGINIKLGPCPTSPTCCPQDEAFDFYLSESSDIRFPKNGGPGALFTGGSYPPFTQCCVSFMNLDSSYKTHEDRFQIATATLYMKVLAGSTLDTLHVRFDTASFLGADKIATAPLVRPSDAKINVRIENGFVILSGTRKFAGGRIAIYDVRGSRVFSAKIGQNETRIPVTGVRTRGVYVVEVREGQERAIGREFVGR